MLLCCEEAFWAGDKKAESVLKDLITSDSIAIERKGLDAFVAPNYTRLLITSNASHAFPASFDERRLFMLTVGNARANDHQYFGEIDEQMLAGGAAAMLHELVNWDLNRAKVRQAPKNHALAEQVIAGLRGLDRWFHEVMITGSITCTPKGAEGSTVALANTATTSVDCGTVLASTEAYTDGRFSTKASATTVGTWLHANVPGLGRHRKPLGSGAPGSARSWHYRFPPLENMRAEYERKLGTALAALGAVDDAASKKVNQFIDALVASKTFDEVRAELDDLYDRNAIDEYRFYEAAIASAEADGLASAAARLKRERDEFVQAEAEL